MAHDNEPRAELPPLRPGARIGAAVSSYHSDVTGAMLESASAVLHSAGLATGHLETVWVPGAFELPVVAQSFAERDDIDAVLCIGLVLKGETKHDEYIANAVAGGLTRISLDTHTPCLFGVLTCNTLEQAHARAFGQDERLDKGVELGRATVNALDAMARARGAQEILP